MLIISQHRSFFNRKTLFLLRLAAVKHMHFSTFGVSVQSRVGGGDSTPRNPMLYGADRAAGVVGPYKRRPRLNRYRLEKKGSYGKKTLDALHIANYNISKS